MKEGKSKVISRTSTGNGYQTDKGMLYSFNMLFEDGQKGLYNSTSTTPKSFTVGEVCEYVAEEKPKKSGDGTYWVVKPKKEPFIQGGGGGYKPKADNVFALELARKMYNSSHQTEKPWSIEAMLLTATFIIKLLKDGCTRDGVECATTIECANAINKMPIDSVNLKLNIKSIDQWLKDTQQS